MHRIRLNLFIAETFSFRGVWARGERNYRRGKAGRGMDYIIHDSGAQPLAAAMMTPEPAIIIGLLSKSRDDGVLYDVVELVLKVASPHYPVKRFRQPQSAFSAEKLIDVVS
jgi:hypothetical protein